MSAPIEIPKTAAKPVSELTERELLEEIAGNMRIAAQAMATFQSSPMSGMLSGMLAPMLGGTGRNKGR